MVHNISLDQSVFMANRCFLRQSNVLRSWDLLSSGIFHGMVW